MDVFFTKYLSQKAPALPLGAKEFLVKWAPYLNLVALLMISPVILAAFGLSAIALPFSVFAGVSGVSSIVHTVIMVAVFALQVAALPGLFKRSISAWNFLYYSTLLNTLSSLLSLNLGGGLIGAAISLYFLYQIKSYYH